MGILRNLIDLVMLKKEKKKKMRDGNIVCSDKLMMVAFEINLHILLNFRNKIKPLMSSYLANKLNRIREDIIFFSFKCLRLKISCFWV